MDKLQLEQKWKALTPDSSGYKSLRIDGVCVPDLFIALHNIRTRCLILKLPENQKIDFQSTEKANLSIEFFRDTKWIIIKLLDNNFIDLFDDLILSIYGKIHSMPDAGEYSSETISMFYKWSEFFNDKAGFRLSEEAIRGIFGEMIVLKELIVETNASSMNDLLSSWKGPYHNRHDFSLQQKDLEVKTKDDSASDVLISSEVQLAEELGKKLELVVVRIVRDIDGISLYELLLEVKQLVINKLADFGIILKGLSIYGVNPRILQDYDDFRYRPIGIDTYNCTHENFPRIVPATISPAINKVNYYIKIIAIKEFLLSTKNLAADGN